MFSSARRKHRYLPINIIFFLYRRSNLVLNKTGLRIHPIHRQGSNFIVQEILYFAADAQNYTV